MKAALLVIIFILLLVVSCSKNDAPEQAANEKMTSEKARLEKADPTGTYGKGITLEEPVAISRILSDPKSFEGQRVLVLGTAVEVCPNRGCWIELTDEEQAHKIQVKVKDGEIVFPLSAKGRQVLAEGIVQKLELTEKQAREWKAHEAEELGNEFDPNSIQGPMTIWRIRGTGAEIKS